MHIQSIILYVCEYNIICMCMYVLCACMISCTSVHMCIYRIYTVNIEQDYKPINILNYVTSLRIEVEGISSQITITDHLFAWFHEPLLDM